MDDLGEGFAFVNTEGKRIEVYVSPLRVGLYRAESTFDGQPSQVGEARTEREAMEASLGMVNGRRAYTNLQQIRGERDQGGAVERRG